MSEFHKFDRVIHMVTRKVYIIVEEPREEKRLEIVNAPFYAYADASGGDKTIWHRAQAEMESRFILAGTAP